MALEQDGSRETTDLKHFILWPDDNMRIEGKESAKAEGEWMIV